MEEEGGRRKEEGGGGRKAEGGSLRIDEHGDDSESVAIIGFEAAHLSCAHKTGMMRLYAHRHGT